MSQKKQQTDKQNTNGLVNVVKDISFDIYHSFDYWRHNLRRNPPSMEEWNPKSKHPPVLVVQGFMGTTGVLTQLKKFLQSQGRNVITIELGFFNVMDIRDSAERLTFEVERILDQYQHEHSSSIRCFDIIGHSMGGLIGLYYVKKLGGHRLVRRLVTLGSPFQGTWAASIGIVPFGLFSKGIWQLLPNSSLLKELHSKPKELRKTKVYSIAAQYDTVCPPQACFLKGAVNRILPLGHAGLLFDKRLFNTVVAFLDEGADSHKVIDFEHFQK